MAGESDATAQNQETLTSCTQLGELIDQGRFEEIKNILQASQQDEITRIEKEFQDQGPIIMALEKKQEDIAIFLIEKGFSFDKKYNYPGEVCDKSCYLDHEEGPCPCQFTVLQHAERHAMPRLLTLIQDIQSGTRKPGDGLTSDHTKVNQNKKKIKTTDNGKTEMKPRPTINMAELQTWIREGKLRSVRDVLDHAEPCVVSDIERHIQFEEEDPVMAAVSAAQEDVAMYLIEKGFKFNKIYNYPGQRCNQYCYVYEHPGDKCHSEFDVLDLAQDKRLARLVNLIQDIQKGLRKPGDGLLQIQKTVKVSKLSNDRSRKAGTPNGSIKSYGRFSQSKLSMTSSTISKNGDTALHQSALRSAGDVHACASEGINVNAKNFDGDTALHIAVRHGNLDTAKALCSNGADLTVRNKLSQTPVEMSSGKMKTLLDSYKRGLVSAIIKGEHSAMQRICRLWPNPDAVVKEDKTVLQLASEQAQLGCGHQACYNLLKDISQSMRLVHAVLSGDPDKLRNFFQGCFGWNINFRYKDKLGETPLSCAVQSHNTEMVKVLLDTGKCNLNIRVREHSWTDVTVPLRFKSLHKDCPTEIWKLLEDQSEPSQLNDRDYNGNTALLRAITNDKPATFIQTMLKSSQGHSLIHRNSEGLHARELALKLNKPEIVSAIDQYICEHPKYFTINLAVAFYGKHHLDIRNVDRESLVDISRSKGTDADFKAVSQYPDVEASAVRLFRAAARGDITQVARGNTANYQDMNGYTALIRAIVFNRVPVAEALLTTRPVLCSMTDNHGRYPLHYAYALPEGEGKPFIKVLMERFGEDKDHCTDKDGRLPAEYQTSRDSPEIQQMLHDARTLDAYGKRGQSLAA